ncbi:hypothetical protein [Candidatus Phytoplasma sacchari]
MIDVIITLYGQKNGNELLDEDEAHRKLPWCKTYDSLRSWYQNMILDKLIYDYFRKHSVKIS